MFFCFLDRHSQLSDEKLIIGEAARSLIKRVPQNVQVGFYTRIRRFYVEMSRKLQATLPLGDHLLKHLQFIDPERRSELDETSICFVAKALRFAEDDLSKLQVEWRRYKICSKVSNNSYKS